MDIVQSHKEEFDKVLSFLKKDISSIRTGRASPELVVHILVEAYGTKTTLEQLAALSVSDAHTIVIQPWDKNITKQIEIALSMADLGTAPQVDDNGVIRLNLPALNEESRKNLAKGLHVKLENARRSLRSVRDRVRESIVKAERNKDITEDDKYRLFEDLDKLSGEKQDEIKTIGEQKEKEIMSF